MPSWSTPAWTRTSTLWRYTSSTFLCRLRRGYASRGRPIKAYPWARETAIFDADGDGAETGGGGGGENGDGRNKEGVCFHGAQNGGNHFSLYVSKNICCRAGEFAPNISAVENLTGRKGGTCHSIVVSLTTTHKLYSSLAKRLGDSVITPHSPTRGISHFG